MTERLQPLHFLLVDNYDSFTFNLSHLFEVCDGVRLTVRRNDDDAMLAELERGVYDGVVISPGPGTAEDENYFGHNAAVIKKFGVRGLPILGICLGFQGVYYHFGGRLKVGAVPCHGKTSRVNIVADNPLFARLPKTLEVMRYHSIIADLDSPPPECLELSAFVADDDSGSNGDNGGDGVGTGGGELMALRHKELPIFGLQFHPESFATEWGGELIANFVTLCRQHKPPESA